MTDIPASCFEDCAALKSVTGGVIETIGANAFSGCKSLAAFDFSETVKSIGAGAFKNCAALKSADFSKIASTIDIPANTFNGCASIEKLGTYAFAGCSKLEKADTSCGSFDIYDAAFLDCPKLTDITLEESNYYSNIGVGHQVGFNSSVDEEGKTVYETTPDMTIRSYVSTNTSS